MAKTYNTFTNVSTGDPLPATTFNNVLTNIANYRVPPICVVEKTQASVADVTQTYVQFSNTALIDTESPSDPMHSSSTNNTRVTIRTSGIYLVTAVSYPAGSTIDVLVQHDVMKNATASLDFVQGVATVNGNATVHTTGVHSLVAGDYLGLRVYQDNSASAARNMYARMSIVWIGQAS